MLFKYKRLSPTSSLLWLIFQLNGISCFRLYFTAITCFKHEFNFIESRILALDNWIIRNKLPCTNMNIRTDHRHHKPKTTINDVLYTDSDEKPQEIYFHFTKLINHEQYYIMIIMHGACYMYTHQWHKQPSIVFTAFFVQCILKTQQSFINWKLYSSIVWFGLCKVRITETIAVHISFACEIFVWFLDLERLMEKLNPCQLHDRWHLCAVCLMLYVA